MSIADAENKGTYQETYSKWASASMKGLKSPVWWAMVEISHRMSAPWLRLREHLHQHRYLVATTGAGSLAHLVHDPDDIHAEFLKLTCVEHWRELIDALPVNLAMVLEPAIMNLAIQNEATYAGRILERITRLPVKSLA